MNAADHVQAATSALSGVPCHCYEPDLTEFYGNEPCPKCKALDHLADLFAILDKEPPPCP
jgi:hypothetical protein